jgi:hypothetical protein
MTIELRRARILEALALLTDAATTVDEASRREKRRDACAKLEESRHPLVMEMAKGAPPDGADDDPFWVSLAGILPAAANDPHEY